MRKHLFLALALLLAGVLRSPAPGSGPPGGGPLTPPTLVSGIFTVDGNEYNITTDTTSFAASAALLGTQPWYGDSSLASDFSTAVGTYLTQDPSSSLPSTSGPLFAFGYDFSIPAVQSQYFVPPGGTTFQSGDPGATYTYALATLLQPVPESSVNPALMAAAGLFIGWRSWRGVRAARA